MIPGKRGPWCRMLQGWLDDVRLASCWAATSCQGHVNIAGEIENETCSSQDIRSSFIVWPNLAQTSRSSTGPNFKGFSLSVASHLLYQCNAWQSGLEIFRGPAQHGSKRIKSRPFWRTWPISFPTVFTALHAILHESLQAACAIDASATRDPLRNSSKNFSLNVAISPGSLLFSTQREPPKRYQRFGHLGASASTTLGRSAHYTCGRGRHMDRHRHLQLGCSGIILKWFDLSDPYCTYWSLDFRIVNFSVFFSVFESLMKEFGRCFQFFGTKFWMIRSWICDYVNSWEASPTTSGYLP